MKIDYTQLGQIGAKAAYQILERDCLKIAVSTKSQHWTIHEDARTAYADAVVKAYLEQVGEGLPSVEDCRNAFFAGENKTSEERFGAARSLMLAAFAKKIEEGTGAWASIAAENLTIAQAKLEAVEKEQGEEITRLTQSATKAWEEADRAKSKIAELTQGIQDQQENNEKLALDRHNLSLSLNDSRESLAKAEKTAESKHGCWMQELAKVSALEKQLSDALPWRESCEKWQAECAKTDAELAKANAEIERLRWRSVEVLPTGDDADIEGYVQCFNKRGRIYILPWDNVKQNSATTHWRPLCAPPAPSAQEVERERFERWALKNSKELTPLGDHDGANYKDIGSQVAFQIWQAARAVKEGEG